MQIQSFNVYMDGATASCEWTPVQDPFYLSYKYNIEHKKTSESVYTVMTTSELSKKITNLLANTAYNFRVRAFVDVLVGYRTMLVGATRTMLVGAVRNIIPNTLETQYSAYSSVITLTTKANYYILGYDNEIIEIPKVYSQDTEDEKSQLNTVLNGNKIRWTNGASKYIINLKTRPIEKSKYMKLYGFVKSRLNQPERIYIDDLKKEITAYIDIKANRFNNDLYELDISIQEA